MREFFERYFGEGAPREEPRQSLGSGLIVEADGYILTNNHVVENARMIMVRLSDEREYEARVVGRGPRTDLALLRIPDGRPLPTVKLGDSDRLRVGDWVLAIGNPFGLEQTVTAGIVSAKGRVIGAGPYDDFIQTDAPINPGNSGGPLFNTQGEVVGINSAIFSQSGGSVGIGFAIPINLAKELVPQLKAKGRITRAWLGVGIAPVTPELAQKLGRAGRDGALIAEVVSNGPAARAGIRPGDVIVALQGRPIRRGDELPRATARAPVGSDVELRVFRDGKELTVTVPLGELPERS
jgi:serine protease Do